MRLYQVPILLGIATSALGGSLIARQASNESCPGYIASNLHDSGSKVTADLTLAGTACNVYGTDHVDLRLEVIYETESRLHVKIYDAEELAYQIPDSLFPRPSSDDVSSEDSALAFSYTASPFTFSIVRRSTNETIFDTSAASLVFENQYLRLRTRLPESPYLYGLGEHTDPFRLNNTNYTRTMWNRDSYGVPTGSNLYGHHPIYFDHRGSAGTHGVFLLNPAGMDIKIDNTDGQYLEYNALGGIFDFYFLAGPTPKDVSVQYSEISGRAAMQPYWGFGFHQCRYGYRDVFAVAETVANYSQAEIPLETMWTDIDYMYLRRVFTLDPERFPIEMMRQLIDTLHANQQKYIVMVDPAVSDRTDELANFGYTDGVDLDIFHKNTNGSGYYKGSVWPGPTVYPDWWHPSTQEYWNNQFARFFDAETGVDIDGLWIDMNEAANFCTFPCLDPEGYADETGAPPTPPPVRNNSGRPIPGFPGDFQPPASQRRLRARQNNNTGKHLGQPGRDLLDPKYKINNAAGVISMNTIQTDIANYDGSHQYDTHNLYGLMMSIASRNALLARRPTRRPLVITRSTFAGAGSHVGKWLGDNLSLWEHYRTSIANILEFASLFQLPMVGADVCGFGGNTTETLCARWATLGAFYPFFRNHNGDTSISQEFYLWPTVTEAARNAISVRYRLLDYIYTHLHRQSTTGLPMLNPIFFQYPEDTNTFAIEHQFFYGDNILVSPVLEENSTDVSIYLPKGIFYDYWTHEKIEGTGSYVDLTDIPFTTIPLHIRGGAILPLREESANTTTELRKKNFVLWIAPDEENKAEGTLFLDDGDSLEQSASSEINFTYDNGTFTMTGTFDYKTDVVISELTILGSGSTDNSSIEYKTPGASKAISGPISLAEEFEKSF